MNCWSGQRRWGKRAVSEGIGMMIFGGSGRMVQQAKKPNTKLLAWVCGIYLVPVIVAVLYTCLYEGRPFDLSLTVSLYVARYPWTTVLFSLHIAAGCVLVLIYLKRVQINGVQRVLYYLILLCILGCAIFPCNRSRSVFATKIHDQLSYVLVIVAALSFAGMLVFARKTRQRVFAIGSLAYTVAFIAVFIIGVPAAKDTIFIWENMVLLLFLLELFMEQYSTEQCTV